GFTVGLALPRRPTSPRTSRAMFLRADLDAVSASITALTGSEIWANRQVYPTIVGVYTKVCPCFNGPGFQFAIGGFIGYL
ncbi:MAG: hypothetical protein ACLQAH_11645, partial [Limisphaerales bacterium]